MSEPAISEYWRLCDELTVQQAVLLIVGIDPASEAAECEHWKPQERPRGYSPVKQALCAALRKEEVTGKNIPIYECDINGNPLRDIDGTTDVYASTVEVVSLVRWLRSRGMNTGFFFPQEDSTSGEPDYLNPKHLRYAPKLAAAVRAWEAVTDPGSRRTPKQALDKWLREHGAAYGLTDDEGKAKETAIEEISKVANWNPNGGVPKTP